MARKSRKSVENFIPHSEDIRCFNAAIYVRLSREEQEGFRNHSSFKNQKAFLLDYVEKHPEINVYKVYEDNGYSGTNFDRPGFSDMMYDVSNEKVDCIIVKDLSRFGREHIETGKYLDYLFPMIGLRFIAVNDNYDTYDKIKDNDMIVPFKNIINAIYSKDIGRKVKSSFDMLRKKGEFIGPFAPYGYLLDANRKFVVDNETAGNVKRIFEMYAEGESMLGICKKLTSEGIDIPSIHKIKKGIIKKYKGSDNVWKVQVVQGILENYAYAGHMVQGRNASAFAETGVKKQVKVPESEWMVVKNTHEAIISEELFQKVAARRSTKHTISKPNSRNIFRGKLFCGECGHRMNVHKSPTSKNRYYKCSYKGAYPNLCDFSDTVRENDLKDAVLNSIKGYISSTMEFDKALLGVNADKEIKQRRQEFERKIRSFRKDIDTNKKQRFELFEDYVHELIEADEFKFARQKYSDTITMLQEKLDLYETEYEKFKKMLMPDEWVDKFRKYKSARNLTTEMVEYFIEKIMLYNNKRIEITWKFTTDDFLNAEVVK